jgi:hypothetical protein
MSDQLLARPLTFAGRPEEAIAVFQSRPVNRGWETLAGACVRHGGTSEGNGSSGAEHRNEHPYRQAIIYAALGDKDRTFEALNRAADLAPHRTAAILFYPEMALLRGDPRLDALKRKLRRCRRSSSPAKAGHYGDHEITNQARSRPSRCAVRRC